MVDFVSPCAELVMAEEFNGHSHSAGKWAHQAHGKGLALRSASGRW